MKDGIKLIAFSAVVFAAAFGLSYQFELPLLLLFLLTFYFTGFSFILNSGLQKAMAHENKNKFTNVFLGLTGVKIFSSLILLVGVLYFFPQNRLHIGICTMAYYMLFTGFEVVLWRNKLSK